MEISYVVKGTTGRYPEDRRTWTVAVFLTEDKANRFRDMCNIRATELLASRAKDYCMEEATPFDPFFCCIDGSISYQAESVPFMETSNEADMSQWHVHRLNKDTDLTAGLALTERQQAQARSMFLASLPTWKSSRKQSSQ